VGESLSRFEEPSLGMAGVLIVELVREADMREPGLLALEEERPALVRARSPTMLRHWLLSMLAKGWLARSVYVHVCTGMCMCVYRYV
jgi:hypothetical protein